MKIRSLLLGSLALAGVSGLAAQANAADLAKGVMTSLDVCDALGLSGLTVSSDTNCLQVTGGVSYMFAWGDYASGNGSDAQGAGIVQTPDDNTQIAKAGGPGNLVAPAGPGQVTNTDWDSQMIAWLQVVGTADSDFGPAKVVIKLKSEQYRHSKDGYGYYDGDDTGGSTVNTGAAGESTTKDGQGTLGGNGPSGTVLFDQAYVSVGDTTVLTAGKVGSIVNTGDNAPLNYLGLFNASNTASGGVLWSVSGRAGGSLYGLDPATGTAADGSGADIQTGGHAIQIVSSLGNGITLKGALEDLADQNTNRAGTAIGVISYAGDNLTAHLSVLEGGILDGHPDVTAYHAGLTGTFDKFKFVGAIAGDSSGYYDGLVSGQATFDMFKLAASAEFTHNSGSATGLDSFGTPYANANGLGYGASIGFNVSDGVSLNLGGRYFDSNTATANNEGYQAAISLVAAVTETLSLTGEFGVYGTDGGGLASTGGSNANGTNGTAGTWSTVEYGAAAINWAPGGGFTSSLKGEAYTNGAYKATFTAAKNFQ